MVGLCPLPPNGGGGGGMGWVFGKVGCGHRQHMVGVKRSTGNATGWVRRHVPPHKISAPTVGHGAAAGPDQLQAEAAYMA